MSAFTWNAGGWFGSQIGGTLWLLLYGLAAAAADAFTAALAAAGFLLLNAWGLFLWRRRARYRAHAALQAFLAAAALVVAVIVIAAHARGLTQAPADGRLASTHLPYWAMAVAPALMLLFWLRERAARATP